MEAWLLNFARNWMGNLVEDTQRYAIFAIGAWFVLWVLLADVLQNRKIREDRPKARQMVLEFLISIRSVAIFSTVVMVIVVLDQLGWLPGPHLARHWGPVWFWTSLMLMIIGHDAYFYWAHRAMHHRKLFRTFHRRHHRSHNPSPFTAYSFDLGEAAVMAAFVPIWMLIVPTPWAVVGLFMLHQIARNTLGHSGYELMPAWKDGRPVFDWITGTTHHDLHHAQAGYNYGLYFTWWDRLMGTEHPEYHAHFAKAVRRPRIAAAPAAAPVMAAE
jgi:sterol desaturase/sphingolipid hydroxylase (fatty acid hydroxylase superfamily)